MEKLFLLPSAVRLDPRIDTWFQAQDHELRQMVQPWFERLRGCGPDVTEKMADGHQVACVGEAALAYVDALTAHAAVGFFCGAMLDDTAGLLEGAGKRMRHVKLRWGQGVDERALGTLIEGAYRDIARASPPSTEVTQVSIIACTTWERGSGLAIMTGQGVRHDLHPTEPAPSTHCTG